MLQALHRYAANDCFPPDYSINRMPYPGIYKPRPNTLPQQRPTGAPPAPPVRPQSQFQTQPPLQTRVGQPPTANTSLAPRPSPFAAQPGQQRPQPRSPRPPQTQIPFQTPPKPPQPASPRPSAFGPGSDMGNEPAAQDAIEEERGIKTLSEIQGFQPTLPANSRPDDVIKVKPALPG